MKASIDVGRRFILTSLFVLVSIHARAELTPIFSSLVPGLDYAHITETNHPWSIHVARLERSHKELDLVSTLAQGKIVGLSSVANQVKTFPAGSGKPLVAVNGDFFVIAKGPYQGDPLGLQILNGELVSAPNGASFWKDAEGNLFLDNVQSKFSILLPKGEKIPFGLNEQRQTSKAVLFTPAFGPSTRTTNGWEFILEKVEGKAWLPLHADRSYEARVQEVRTTGDSPLAEDKMIISIDPKLASRFAGIQPGTILHFSTGTSRDIAKADTAVGGRPLLLVHGKELETSKQKGNNAATIVRHPRTALGWNARYFFLVVVDGRQKELSMGMSSQELAHFMSTLGCTEAMNLDGGGSTTFWLDGKVVNSPSDRHERSVANALIIMQHRSDPGAQNPLQKAAN
ncbi:phosphodiester glycosidase family protein [Pedosphaera parvula]|uniref:Phosphodiester glycosidase domain-containing protein n=1 Tax=Pedosphaera parvula (strain Ellin514) TaxID=320771 RepID=B9XE16_PEDPL|nr:phosphodiester glycosidase family protein [Pedosphaera parvula]EEF61907.1 conserved hypothetical protein [Pedosphaera parvula Ellin514]